MWLFILIFLIGYGLHDLLQLDFFQYLPFVLFLHFKLHVILVIA